VRLSKILANKLINEENLFYNMFTLLLRMFRALCAHHRKSKLYYTASGNITPVDSRTVHNPISTSAPDGHL